MSNQYSIDPTIYYNEKQLKVLSLLDRLYDFAQLKQKYNDQRQPIPARVECETASIYDKVFSLIAGLDAPSVKRREAFFLLDRYYDLAQLEQKYFDQRKPLPARIQGDSLRVYDELLNMIADISRATDTRKRHDGK